MVSQPTSSASLSRTLGFWALVFYGIGDILGAGIYVLVSEVSAEAGALLWVSFLLAMFAAGLTALSYAELVGCLPESAGEVAFVTAAFRRPWLAFLTGWLVFCSGIVSMSAVAHACGNYVQGTWPQIPGWTVWVAFVVFVSAINFWGIRQSSRLNVVFTLIEMSGLLLVIFVGAMYYFQTDLPKEPESSMAVSFVGVMQGATLAFFAYVGFEDMNKVAEEVKSPERIFPKAIMTTVLFCGGMYLLVSLACLAVLPASELARSEAPLLDVVRRAAPSVPPVVYTGIALVAVTNTGLLNSIMASRLLYGMAKHRLLPTALSAVNQRTQTPHWAILTLAGIALALIFSGTLTQLASTVSFLLLLVFALVNGSLLRIRIRDGRKEGAFSVPLVVPIVALATCVGLAAFVKSDALPWGGGILALGGGMAFVAHRRRIAATAIDSDAADHQS